MSVGLIALLDDVAGLLKITTASLDDLAGQAMKAGSKAAGVVIDDAAVTPRYVAGLGASRELPVVWRIAAGSLRNKILILLPAALALGAFAPWLITPILVLGGAYLAYEGTEKVYAAIAPGVAHVHEAKVVAPTRDAASLEDERVAGAIRTDMILSAEIMAIALASVPGTGIWEQAVILAMVGIGTTVAIYGAVALIVKADDAGLALAAIRAPSWGGAAVRLLGRGLVRGTPILMSVLSVVGTAAMIWVGGGIILHAVEGHGWLPGFTGAIHHAAEAAGRAAPAISGFASWAVTALASGAIGLVLGGILIPVVENAIAPAWHAVRRALPATA